MVFWKATFLLLIPVVCFTKACPDYCRCSYSFASCESWSHTALPPGLPKTISRLNIDLFELQKLTPGYFQQFPNLEKISMTGGRYETFDAGVFADLKSIRYIYIGDNDLRYLPSKAFNNLKTLETILLVLNSLRELKADAFIGMDGLRKLDLQYNVIGTIPAGCFSGAKNLRELQLVDNDIHTIDTDAFAGLNELTKLHLDMNEIQIIEINAFSDLKKLQHLSMSYNKLTIIDKGTFDHTHNLQTLDLSSNSIKYIAPYSFGNLFKSLYSLKLSENILETIRGNTFVGLEQVSKFDLSSNGLTNIQDGAFNGMPKLQDLGLDNNKLTFLNRGTFKYTKNLIKLSLHGNLIENIADIKSSFEFLANLNTLTLSRNKITKISTDDFTDLTKLAVLEMKDNKITEIQSGAFPKSIQSLSFRGNVIRKADENALSGMTKLEKLDLTYNLWRKTGLRGFTIRGKCFIPFPETYIKSLFKVRHRDCLLTRKT